MSSADIFTQHAKMLNIKRLGTFSAILHKGNKFLQKRGLL